MSGANRAQQLAAEINAALGDQGIIMGDDPSLVVSYIATGVLPIDDLLMGGIPRGRWMEIYGDYSTLKSYIAYKALAAVQEDGGIGALVDSEHSYDPVWFHELGGDPDSLIVRRPEYGEKAVMAIEALLRSEENVDLIVWDSIASTAPKDQVERSPDDTVQPGRLAAMMSEGLRRMTAANRNTAILCLNQTRTNVGITYGSSESIPGGKALPFYASYRLSLRKAGYVQEEARIWNGQTWANVKQRTHVKIKATMEKSKLNAPQREVWFHFDMTQGSIDESGYIMGKALEQGLLERTTTGRWSWAKPAPHEAPVKRGKKPKTYTEKQLRATLNDRVLDWMEGELQ